MGGNHRGCKKTQICVSFVPLLTSITARSLCRTRPLFELRLQTGQVTSRRPEQRVSMV
jgi:hypothetical protein